MACGQECVTPSALDQITIPHSPSLATLVPGRRLAARRGSGEATVRAGALLGSPRREVDGADPWCDIALTPRCKTSKITQRLKNDASDPR